MRAHRVLQRVSEVDLLWLSAFRARARWLACVVWLFACTQASAQDQPAPAANSGQGEIIEDPELAGSAPSSTGSASGSGEVIDDPELRQGTPSQSPAPASDGGGSGSPSSEVHLVLHTRGNRDLKQDDPREEIWESTTIFALDATLRRSERLRFGLGLSARYHFASLAHDLPDAIAGG